MVIKVTACNNEGQLSFEYNLEDTDIINEANVFNGQDSVLWINVRLAFADELKSMYSTLRSDNSRTFNYKSIRDKMNNHQSVWPEVLWNEDAYVKWLEPYLTKGTDYLGMLQGDKKSQRDWWLYYGFRYRDSKYECGDSATNVITLRCYANEGSMYVTPYSHLYLKVQFGSYSEKKRATRGQTYEFTHVGELNDTETYIYSADCISDIGDLSPFKVGMIDVSAAPKLQQLIVGNPDPSYRNLTFEGVSTGSNDLLSYLNIENCVIDYTKHTTAGTINLSNCHGLELIKARGSNIKSIILPDGGHLSTLELPGTLTGIVIKNQKYFETMSLDGYDKIATLNFENTPNLPIETLLLNSPLLRLRLKNIEWTVTDENTLRTIFNKLTAKDEDENYLIHGYNDVGAEINSPQISGKVHIQSISNELIEAINTIYPELVIVVNGEPKFFIRYNNKDNTKLYSYIADAGTSAPDPTNSTEGYPTIENPIPIPTFADTPDSNGEIDTLYTFEGWTELPQDIQKPYIIIADYEETYRVRFYKDIYLTEKYDIEDQWISEDHDAVDPITAGLLETPTQTPSAQYSYIFKKWSDDLTVIRKPLNVYPTFTGEINIYTVLFTSNGVLLQDPIQVPYGETAIYRGNTAEIPYYEEGGVISEAWEFEKWDQSLVIQPKEYTTEPIIISAVFIFKGNLDDVPWEEIAEAAAQGNINKYGIGSTKVIEMTVDGENYRIEVELIGKNYDRLDDSKISAGYNGGKNVASFTFGVKEILPWKKPMSYRSLTTDTQTTAYPTVGGWELSTLREWCNDEFFAKQIPEDLKTAIKPVQKISDIGYTDNDADGRLNTTIDYVWTFSATELNLDGPESELNYIQGQSSTGTAYTWFVDNESRIKKFNGIPSSYWTRTHSAGHTHRYINIDNEGGLNNNATAGSNLGVVIGFCI